MTASTKKQLLPRVRIRKTTRIPLGLTTIVPSLLLMILSFLTGCGSGGETGSDPSITVAPGNAGATASLTWNPVQDPSVTAYYLHYGRQSPNQSGSCAYESFITVNSPSATVTDLDPDTRYYFTVSAFNGKESPCSNEVSTVTPAST